MGTTWTPIVEHTPYVHVNDDGTLRVTLKRTTTPQNGNGRQWQKAETETLWEVEVPSFGVLGKLVAEMADTATWVATQAVKQNVDLNL